MDIEGNEQAVTLAKKGVEKHGIKLKGEEEVVREQESKKRKAQEEQEGEEEDGVGDSGKSSLSITYVNLDRQLEDEGQLRQYV